MKKSFILCVSFFSCAVFAQKDSIPTNIHSVESQFIKEDSKLILKQVDDQTKDKNLQQQTLDPTTFESSISSYPKDVKNSVTITNKDIKEPFEVDKDQVKEPSISKTNVQILGDWKVDLDLKTKEIKILGQDNRITNVDSQATLPLKLSLYYTLDKYSGNGELKGFEIFNVDLQPIAAKSFIREPQIKSNYFNKVPKGEYYLIMTITEKGNDDIYRLKAYRVFDNVFKFE